MTKTVVTEENYLDYLTFHGRTINCAWSVVKNWGCTDDYHTNDAIRLWVDASAIVLEKSGVK